MKRYETQIQEQWNKILPPDAEARKQAQEKWANCAHPLGSLGNLETMIAEIAALTGTAKIDISKKALLVFCADHGVVAQGVSQSESSVTTNILIGLAKGRTAVCKMAEIAGCQVIPVDVGVKEFAGMEGVAAQRIGNGTADFTQGAAMTREQAAQAIFVGMEQVRLQKEKGVSLLATGEAGIGNTTAAAAVASVLLGKYPQEMAGRGAGLSDAGLRRKIKAIETGIRRNQPDSRDALDVLAKVGGFDIAAMCGAFLGGALYGVPILMDGLISSVAALCAVRLCPLAEQAIFASHVSAEPSGALLLQALGKEPLITAGMRLGEGTGAVAAMPLLDMAAAVYEESYGFAECGIAAYVPQEENGCLHW